MKSKFKIITIGLVLALSCYTSLVYAALNDNGDGTVTDTDTGLTWLKQALPVQANINTLKTWSEAKEWAESLVYAGHDDWRLPSAIHFNTGVIDYSWDSRTSEWGHLNTTEWENATNEDDTAPMSNYTAGRYWTGTEDHVDSEYAAAFYLTYDLASGHSLFQKDNAMKYTAVRGAPEPEAAIFTFCMNVNGKVVCPKKRDLVIGVMLIVGFGVVWFRRKKKKIIDL